MYQFKNGEDSKVEKLQFYYLSFLLSKAINFITFRFFLNFVHLGLKYIKIEYVIYIRTFCVKHRGNH